MSAATKYTVHLHATDNPAKTVRRRVSIDSSMPTEGNDQIAGGIAVGELWAEEETLYEVDSVEGPK